MKASLATVAVALLLLVGCGGDDGGDEPEDGPETTEATGTGDAPATDDLSSYDDITSLNEDLAAAGIECTLEYDGLVDAVREISQCPIDGSLAVLTVWYDDGLREEFLATEPAAVAYGANWTVETGSPETAAAVADAAAGATTDG